MMFDALRLLLSGLGAAPAAVGLRQPEGSTLLPGDVLLAAAAVPPLRGPPMPPPLRGAPPPPLGLPEASSTFVLLLTVPLNPATAIVPPPLRGPPPPPPALPEGSALLPEVKPLRGRPSPESREPPARGVLNLVPKSDIIVKCCMQ